MRKLQLNYILSDHIDAYYMEICKPVESLLTQTVIFLTQFHIFVLQKNLGSILS